MNARFVLCFALTSIFSVYVSADTNFCPYNCGNTANIGCANNLTLADTCNGKSAKLYQYNATEQKIILTEHNKCRNDAASGSLVGLNSEKLKSASRMAQMTWSNDLATQACYNAKRCIYGHDQCHNTPQSKYSGQNIAINGVSNKYPDVIPGIKGQINSWYSEYSETTNDNLQHYPEESKYDIGHFTAMVNDRATQVGCCSVQYRDTWYWFFTVCNYAQTNIINYATYKTGTPCSGCTTGCSSTYKYLCTLNENINPNVIY